MSIHSIYQALKIIIGAILSIILFFGISIIFLQLDLLLNI
jgi:hypothetical protein